MNNTEIVKISELKLNPDNPRIIKDEKFKKLVKSIKELPRMLELRPIVVNDNMMVLGGNMRLKACREIGLDEVPIIIASKLTPEQQRQFVIKDNLGYGDWDWDMLANDWDKTELEDWGMDIPNFAFKDEIAEDDFEAGLSENPITILGDVYELNQHRFTCGDSIKAEVVEKTLNDAKPILMVTDPPYGVNYDPDWRNNKFRSDGTLIGARTIGRVNNDHRIDWSSAFSLFCGNIVYVWHSDRYAKQVHEYLEQSGFDIVAQLIWAKNGHVIGRGDYHFQHEPCWYGVRKNQKHNWQGSRSETSLWEIPRNQKNETGHSTQKPVECMARPIRNNSAEGESVYDPFLGSGTTIIAAEQLNRICYGQEIDPCYCDIIVARWLKFMQSQSKETPIIVKKNGKELSEEEKMQYLEQTKQKERANSDA